MMDYTEETSDHDEASTSKMKVTVIEEDEGTGDYSQGGNGSSCNVDPLSEASNSFHNLQEALAIELQKFQELGKEPISSSLHDGAESRSCVHVGYEQASEASSSSSRRVVSENMEEAGLASIDSEILNLLNNVDHLETKLEETRSILKAKESQICELESTISVPEPLNRESEFGIEDVFKQKMEAEIEYIVFSRSVGNLKRKIIVVEEEKALAEIEEGHKMMSKLGEAETKAEKLKKQAQVLQNHCAEIQEDKGFKKKVFKTTSCLLLQFGLLLLFSFQLMPEPEIVVPT
ncbi:unnamed protein product [Cochlearia groenlandica]